MPGKFESSNLSRDDLSREIGRRYLRVVQRLSSQAQPLPLVGDASQCQFALAVGQVVLAAGCVAVAVPADKLE